MTPERIYPMAGNHNQSADVDPHVLEEARKLWSWFTISVKYGVIGTAAILLLMALILL
jgi:hypothetical protein